VGYEAIYEYEATGGNEKGTDSVSDNEISCPAGQEVA